MKIYAVKFWLASVALLFAWQLAVSDAVASPAAQKTDDYISADAAQDDYLADRPEGIYDPLEGLNRGIFWVNRGVDTIVLRPVSQVYKFVVPEFGRDRVGNFMHNLQGPLVTFNSLLQGDPQNMFVSFWRFVFNSTLGVFGLFDIASELGVPQQHDEDFGQTLGVWGVANGPYLMLPLFGPSTLRDTAGLGVDMVVDPFTYAPKSHERYKIMAVRVVDTRARIGKLLDDTYESSLDPYATFRSLYLQHREAQVLNKGAESESDGKVSLNKL